MTEPTHPADTARERKATKWAWRGNHARLRSLDAKEAMTEDEADERAGIVRWIANHDEPKRRPDRQ